MESARDSPGSPVSVDGLEVVEPFTTMVANAVRFSDILLHQSVYMLYFAFKF